MNILLDTNVWRYLVDARAVGRLVSIVKKSGCSLCVAPATVYEATHSRDAELRHQMLRAMLLPSWKRLRPEAWSEAEEVKGEIRRCHPEWLRRKPDLVTLKGLAHDWIRRTGGAWDRAANRPGLVAAIQRPSVDQARKQSVTARKEVAALRADDDKTPLSEIVEPCEFVPYAGQAVAAWRASVRRTVHIARSDHQSAYFDWLDAEVDLALMPDVNPYFQTFWVREVEASRVPRHWLRWAFRYLQERRKVSPGTPVDRQISTYLCEVDRFLSADKVMVSIAERCRAEAPFSIAESTLVPGGAAAVDELERVFAIARRRR